MIKKKERKFIGVKKLPTNLNWSIRPECPIVLKDWFFKVLMLIHGEHLDRMLHLNEADMMP